MTHNDIIALIEAHKAGITLQIYSEGEGEWVDARLCIPKLIHRITPEHKTAACGLYEQATVESKPCVKEVIE